MALVVVIVVVVEVCELFMGLGSVGPRWQLRTRRACSRDAIGDWACCNRNCFLTTANARMPGPRNSKGQKKLNALREKKRKVVVKPVATPPVDRAVTRTDAAPHVGEQKQDAADVGESVVGLDEVERSLPREPPVYDAGTGPRVKSMDEFLRSSFASEPTWDDELCAEFAQEEMLEMLRTVLPEEMALVSAGHTSGSFR